MTDCDRVNHCVHVERRKGERRKVVARTTAWCARFVAIVVVGTSVLSIGSAVSITTYAMERRLREPSQERAALRRDLEAVIRRIETLEQLESHRHRTP